jgi:hypothetical protein
MAPRRLLWSIVALSWVWCCTPSPAGAQGVDDATRSAARNLGTAGVEAYQAGNFATAHDKLEKAYGALHAPSLGLWSARALVAVGHLVEAGERYREVTRLSVSGGDQAIQKQARADAETELGALSSRIPSVVIGLVGADPTEVQVTIDGTAVAAALLGESRPVNPGKHHVVGKRGGDVVALDVTLAESEKQTALLHFKPSAASSVAAGAADETDGARGASPPRDTSPEPAHGAGSRKLIGLVVTSVGVAALGTGAVFAGLTKSEDNKASKLCTSGASHDQCLDATEQTDFQQHTDRAHSWAKVSYVGFGVGAAALVTGAILLLGGHSETSALRVTPLVGFEGLGLGAETAW